MSKNPRMTTEDYKEEETYRAEQAFKKIQNWLKEQKAEAEK